MKFPSLTHSVAVTALSLLAPCVRGQVNPVITGGALYFTANQTSAAGYSPGSYRTIYDQGWSRTVDETLPTSAEVGPFGSGSVTADFVNYTFAAQPNTYAGFNIYNTQATGGAFDFQILVDVNLGNTEPTLPHDSLIATYSGGTLDGMSFAVDGQGLSVADLPSVPLFSAETFNHLTGGTLSGPTQINFASFTVPVGASNSGRQLFLSGWDGVTQTTLLNGQSIDPLTTSYDFVAGTFVDGTIYQLTIMDFYATGTGSINPVSYYTYNALSFTASVSAVPEPSTCAALFGLAALGLASSRRRRHGPVVQPLVEAA